MPHVIALIKNNLYAKISLFLGAKTVIKPFFYMQK